MAPGMTRAQLISSAYDVSFDPRENIELGEELFSFGSYTGRARKTGPTATGEWMFRWRVHDGKIVSWDSYIDTAAMLAAVK